MIQTAIVVPGSETQAGAGITGAIRCALLLPDNTRRSAVLKRGPVGHIAAEAFSAVLLKAWGLPVPQPFLISEAQGSLAFASADAGYPSLYKRFALDALPPGKGRDAAIAIAAAMACQLPSAGLAAAADEAIENLDRNLGNILWDGTAEAWIDHAFALGQAPSGMPDTNKLCTMAIGVGKEDAMRSSAVTHALVLDRTAPAQAANELPPDLDGPALAARVAGRLASLASGLIARFPGPVDLLSGL